MKLFQKKSGIKGIAAAVLIAAAVIAVCLCVAYLYAQSTVENNAELADLYGMRNAELAAKVLLNKNEKITENGYWFDPVSYKLIPDSETKPSGMGLGTVKRGQGLIAFENKTGQTFPYDEGTDYRDQVIHVTIGEKIVVEWVPAD